VDSSKEKKNKKSYILPYQIIIRFMRREVVSMSRDQTLGALILVGAIVVIGIFGWLMYVPEYRIAALVIVATIAVVGVMGIIAWIGWTMATTPAPEPIGSIEEPEESSSEEE